MYTDLVDGDTYASRLATLLSRSSANRGGLAGLLEKKRVKPLKPHMNELRAIKSDSEIANMRRAGQASGRAITKAMGRKFYSEKDLAAFLDYNFKRNGCDSSAYVPVVAGGEVNLRSAPTR